MPERQETDGDCECGMYSKDNNKNVTMTKCSVHPTKNDMSERQEWEERFLEGKIMSLAERWVSDKCNWEQRSRLAINNEYIAPELEAFIATEIAKAERRGILRALEAIDKDPVPHEETAERWDAAMHQKRRSHIAILTMLNTKGE